MTDPAAPRIACEIDLITLFPAARVMIQSSTGWWPWTMSRHAGEGETSILLDQHPEVVRDSYRDADHRADEHPHLLTVGMAGYTESGVIGVPSAATAEKGRLLLDAFSAQFKDYLDVLR